MAPAVMSRPPARAEAVSFSPRAVQAVHQYSAGIPRLINLICDRSLLGAYSTRSNKVSPDLVVRAAETLDLRPAEKSRFSWFRRHNPLAAGMGAGSASGR